MAIESTPTSEVVGAALCSALRASGDLPPGINLDRVAAGQITVGQWFVLAERLGRTPESFL